jgi:hypothetical protein
VHFRTTHDPKTLRVTDIGWGLERGQQPWRIHTERDEDPTTYLVVVGGGPVARKAAGARDVVPIKPVVPLRGGRLFLLSQYALPHLGAVDQLGIHRLDLNRPLTPAERKLVRLFHVELGRLWKRDALHRAADPSAELPPRLVQTLDGILHGDSEKQIAFALGLSRHTIHNYIRALHRRFGVSSRAELIAKATDDRADFRPKLSVAPRESAVPHLPPGSATTT